MRLTSDHKKVAVFQDIKPFPVEGIEGSQNFVRNFSVGPFRYELEIDRAGEGVYAVSFMLLNIDYDSTGEMIAIASDIKGKQVGYDEAKEIIEETLDESIGTAKLGKNYGMQVLNQVVGASVYFVNRYKPNCMIFSAETEDRRRIYQRMVKRVFPKAVIQVTPGYEGEFDFRVCFI